MSVRTSVAWMTLSQGGLVVLQFGASLLIARLLSPYETGVFAVGAAMAGLLGMLRTLGLSSYVIRAPALSEAFLRSVFTVNALVNLVIAALTLGLGMLGGRLLGEPGVADVLVVLALVPLVNILEFRPSACVEHHKDFRSVALVNLWRSAAGTAVMLGFAIAGHGAMSLAYGQLAGAVVVAAGLSVVGWRFVGLGVSLAGARDILRYGVQILATSGVSTLAAKLTECMLGAVLGLHALGLYSRAAGLQQMLSENFNIVASRVAFVDLVERRRRGMSLRGSYLRVLDMSTALLWPAFAGLGVLAGPVLLVLYGPGWVEAWPVLSLLCAATVVTTAMVMTWEVFVACEQTGRMARLEVAHAGMGVVLFAAGCLGGVAGAAASRIADALFAAALFRPHLGRLTDTVLEDCLPILLRNAGLTALAVLPAAAVMTAHGWQPTAPLPLVLAAMGGGILAWAVGVWAMRHPLYFEGVMVLARLRGRQDKGAVAQVHPPATTGEAVRELPPVSQPAAARAEPVLVSDRG